MNYAKIINIALLIVVLMASIQLSVAQELSLTYDANGNLVTGDGYYRVYNSLNQLWKIYNGSNQNGTMLEELIYHPTEERVYIKRMYNSDGNVTETVYYISQRFVRVVNQSGTYDFGYVYHNGQLVAQDNPDGTILYIHGDHLGSSSAVTNESGDAVENTTYSPFGVITSGGNTTRYDYTGQEFDSVLGDYDFNTRRYNAMWGRFIQPDLLLPDIYDPQQLNRYGYVRNNPYRYIDPLGRAIDVEFDDENNEITIRAVIYVYGDEASEEVAEQCEQLINEAWGGYTFEGIDGEEYTVKLDVRVYYTENEPENLEKYENAFEITDVERSHVIGREIFGKVYTNSGKLKGSSPNDIVHEFGHLAGLDDQYKDVYYENYFETVPYSGWNNNVMGGLENNVEKRNVKSILYRRHAMHYFKTGVVRMAEDVLSSAIKGMDSLKKAISRKNKK